MSDRSRQLENSRRAVRIRRVLEDCLARRAAGELISDEVVIAQNADLLPELSSELDLLRIMEGAARAPHARSGSSSRRTIAIGSGPSNDLFPGYTTLREIHRGGQGIVYEAIQQSTRRRVAIKATRESFLFSPGDRARFEREIHILSQLKHPNIVTIHDRGRSGDQAFFVMDYIDGLALDQYVQQSQVSEGDSRVGPSTLDDHLELFATICDTVNSAHLQGVIHRDLKPSNILIDESGQPHVLDFGLAKLSEGSWIGALDADEAGASAAMTMTGHFIGSVPWASPEQARGESTCIDLRTDVYALGVVFYRVLVGRFPYDVSGPMHEVLHRIISDDPVRPSVVQPAFDHELETILLKCLNKEPERRYQSARELGLEFRRYLANEPIEAKRDSAYYLLKKQLQRHRGLIGAGLLAVVALIGFTIYAGFQARLQRQLAQREHEASERARASEDRAIQLQSLAEEEAVRAKSVTQYLMNTFGLDNAEVTQMEDLSFSAMLDRASESVDDVFTDEPATRAEIHQVIGRAYASLGMLEAARDHLKENLRMQETQLGGNDRAVYDALWPYVMVLDESSDPQWRTYWWKLWYLQRKLILEAHPDFKEPFETLSACLGFKYWRTEAVARAVETELVDLTERTLDADDPDWLLLADFYHLGGNNVGLKGYVRDQLNNNAEVAGRFLERALAIRRRFLPETSSLVIRNQGDLTAYLLAEQRFEEALQHADQAIDLLGSVLPDDHWYLDVFRARRGAALAGLGQSGEAESILLHSRERLELARGPNNIYTREVLEHLIYFYDREGRSELAERYRVALATALAQADPANYYYRLAPLFGPDRTELLEAFYRYRDRKETADLWGDPQVVRDLLELRHRELADEHPTAAVLARIFYRAGIDLARGRGRNETTYLLFQEAASVARVSELIAPRTRAEILVWLTRNAESCGDCAEVDSIGRELEIALTPLRDEPGVAEALQAKFDFVAAQCRISAGNLQEAERLLLGVADLHKIASDRMISDEEERATAQALHDLYLQWNMPTKAAAWEMPTADNN